MPIYELTKDELREIEETTFSKAKIRERADLQRLLRNQIKIISPDTLIVTEEFGEWDESKRRIDLLGIDKDASLVVFELKRTEDGGHMDLQALRYAAMVSTMTFDKTTDVYKDFLKRNDSEEDAENSLMEFLEWDERDEENFAQDVRIVLVSAEFSKEITSTVLWLNDYGLDIRCVRMKPYNDNGRTLVDIEQVIPLPEASAYQVGVREKKIKEKNIRVQNRDMTKYDVIVFGKSEEKLAKRNAIFFVVKNLCDSDTTLEKIKRLIYWKGNLFLQVDGTLSSDEFIQVVSTLRQADGGKIEYRRWYYKDDELIHLNGKTYAFLRMWGNRWGSAMKLLKENFPEANIEFKPSNGE